jgi:Glycosyltransferase family 28 C-terminal domain
MEEWMHACDVIITKAGPGTIAESFICGLPVLLNGFIPGQEEGNIEYVLEHQVRSGATGATFDAHAGRCRLVAVAMYAAFVCGCSMLRHHGVRCSRVHGERSAACHS